MNRFFDIEGDVSTQLAPWAIAARGLPLKAQFRLEKEIRFYSNIAGGIIIIPVGFISDLASIPQFAWSIFMASDDPRIELGAWVHDKLYEKRGVVILASGVQTKLDRDQCDQILADEAMVTLGATEFQRWAVYKSLKYFGDRWE